MYHSLKAKDNVTDLVVVLCCFSNSSDEFAQSHPYCFSPCPFHLLPMLPLTKTACFLNTWHRLRMQFSAMEIFLCAKHSVLYRFEPQPICEILIVWSTQASCFQMSVIISIIITVEFSWFYLIQNMVNQNVLLVKKFTQRL